MSRKLIAYRLIATLTAKIRESSSIAPASFAAWGMRDDVATLVHLVGLPPEVLEKLVALGVKPAAIAAAGSDRFLQESAGLDPTGLGLGGRKSSLALAPLGGASGSLGRGPSRGGERQTYPIVRSDLPERARSLPGRGGAGGRLAPLGPIEREVGSQRVP